MLKFLQKWLLVTGSVMLKFWKEVEKGLSSSYSRRFYLVPGLDSKWLLYDEENIAAYQSVRYWNFRLRRIKCQFRSKQHLFCGCLKRFSFFNFVSLSIIFGRPFLSIIRSLFLLEYQSLSHRPQYDSPSWWVPVLIPQPSMVRALNSLPNYNTSTLPLYLH